MESEEVARQLDNRVGYEVVAYGEVGLPIYRITAIVLCVTRRKIDPVAEFVLRAMHSGARDTSVIAGLLGLSDSMVDSTLADLVRDDCVRSSRTRGGRRSSLS